MNENEQTLLENLRGLAEDGPREAPAIVEQRLMAAFKRRSRSRRVRTWGLSGTAAIIAGVALMLWIRPAPPKPAPAVARAVVPESPKMPAAIQPEQQKISNVRKANAAPRQAAMSFYPLPEADDLPPVENATVVRVQLPMSSLRLIGFPVNEARAGDRVQADVLVGQDGLARGVRFVQ